MGSKDTHSKKMTKSRPNLESVLMAGGDIVSPKCPVSPALAPTYPVGLFLTYVSVHSGSRTGMGMSRGPSKMMAGMSLEPDLRMPKIQLCITLSITVSSFRKLKYKEN